jgi:hypothetical protein
MTPRLALCALLASLVAVLPAAPAAAGESLSHPFIGELGGNEGTSRTPSGAFEDACAVALDSHGDAYVSDYYHDAVDVFGPTREYLTRIANESLGNGPCALAVDSAGNVYVNDWRQDVVRFTPSSDPPTAATTYGPGTVIDESGTATGVAIDPASGNVYVDNGTYIAEYEPSGHPVEVGGEPVHIDLGPLAEGYGLAISAFHATEGDLYVPDAASRTVRVFGPAGETLPAIDGTGTPQSGFAYLSDASVAVDPNDGHIFVLDNVGHGQSEHPEAVIDEFNPAGDYRGQIGHWITHPPNEPGVTIQHSLFDAEPSGLAIDSAGKVYVTSENSDASESGALDRNGKPLEGSLLYTFGPTAPAATLTLAKTGAGVGTVKSEPAGIQCGSACAAEYDLGAKVTLTGSPDPHSSFAGWSGSGCSGTGICKVTMSEARSVGAEFTAIPQQTLEVGIGGSGEGTVTSSPAGIHCSSGTCTEHFNEGSTVALIPTPAPHNRFLGWEAVECDELVGTTCRVTMTSARAVSASFGPIPQQTLEVSVSGSGEVSSSPAGIDCGPTCSEHFDEDTTVTLTATPAIHNQVAWSGCSAEPDPTQCEVTMSAAKSVSAAFSPILHTVTVTVLGAGSVSADHGAVSGCKSSAGACSGTYEEGEAVTLNASPAAGSAFAGWSGGCGGTGPCHLTIGDDTAATANFAAIPPPPNEGGSSRLSLGKLSVKGAVATLQASVSGPGSVVASGNGLKTARAHAAAAGALTLRLALSAAARRTLAKRGKLTVKARITFTPSGGGFADVTVKAVTFGPKGHRKPQGPKPHGSKAHGEASVAQNGNLFARFDGGITPAALPRHSLAPIGLSVDAIVTSFSDQGFPALRQITIAVNRYGHLDTRGLPVCRFGQIAASSDEQALSVCGAAVVGSGSYDASTAFPEQATFPSHGKILAFNSIVEGHPAILAHIYGADPIPITRILVFRIHNTNGVYGTVLSAELPASVNPYGYLKRIELNLYRRFTVHGLLRSYLSAACAAPPGFPGAVFSFANASLGFADGRTLSSTLTRSCKVRK